MPPWWSHSDPGLPDVPWQSERNEAAPILPALRCRPGIPHPHGDMSANAAAGLSSGLSGDRDKITPGESPDGMTHLIPPARYVCYC